MGKYILKRLILMVINIIIVTFVLFALIRMLPVTIATSSAVEKAALIEKYTSLGINFSYNDNGTIVYVTGKPIIVQFGIWLSNAFHGDLGSAFNISTAATASKAVTDIIAERIGVTVQLNIISFIISVPLGLAFGILAALKKNKLTDHIISVIVMLFISVPSFVVALLMIYALGFKAGIFPLYYTGEAISMVLPILALSFGTIAGLTRYTRAELTEVLTNDFMLLARAKGLTRAQATVRHALRNSMVPVMPIILWNFISILAGSYVIETAFSIPGIGKLIITAITSEPAEYDLYVAMSTFYTILSFVGALIVDLAYGFIDPRIRMGGKK